MKKKADNEQLKDTVAEAEDNLLEDASESVPSSEPEQTADKLVVRKKGTRGNGEKAAKTAHEKEDAGKVSGKTDRKEKTDEETAGKTSKRTGKKKKTDVEAARQVSEAITALGDSTDPDDADAVTAAREAYENLTEDQVMLIPEDLLNVLITAEQMIEEAANAFPDGDSGIPGTEESGAGTQDEGYGREILLEGKYLKRIKGYQVEYSKDEDFSDSKTVLIKSLEDLSKFVGKLKSGKQYYVRIRVCVKVKKEKYYFEWSEVRILRT